MSDPYYPYVLVDGVLVDAPVDLQAPTCIPVRQKFALAEHVFMEDENFCPCGTPVTPVETGLGECPNCTSA